MSSVRRSAFALVASAGLVLASVVPASAATGGVPFTVELTGEAEVTPPNPPSHTPTQWGDPDGSGTATVTVNPGLGEVCWTIDVENVATVTHAHIHQAPSTANGPVVVEFDPYGAGCAEVERSLALAIVVNPSDYYVNVHTTEYPLPSGAVRGQLSR